MSYDLPYMCNWKKNHNNKKPIDTEDRLGIADVGMQSGRNEWMGIASQKENKTRATSGCFAFDVEPINYLVWALGFP